MVIEITRAGIDKSPRVSEPLLRCHYALPDILENSILIKIDPPNENRKGLIEVLTFAAKVMLDNYIIPVIIKVRHYSNGHYYYMIGT